MRDSLLRDQKERALTIRSLLLGIVMVIIVNVGSSYSLFILHSTLISVGYLPLIVIFLFFVIVVIFNGALKSFNPRWALRPPELAVVFVMTLLGVTFQPFGSVSLLMGVISSPYYFASPENQWAQYLFKHIPNWIAPSRSHIQAIKWFWEGLPPGEKIPWRIWVVPLFWWFSFIGVVFWVCICIVSILRKQWVERERIAFPLMEVPIKMIQEAGSKSLLPAVLRSRLFWIGFAVPFFIIVWNIVHYFSPLFPEITVIKGGQLSIGRSFPSIPVGLSFHLIGFAYFASLDVLLSIWVFYLLSVFQIGLYNRIGFSIGLPQTFCSEQPSMGWQGFGGLIAIVAYSLWMARTHLKDAFRKAFGKNSDAVDSSELLSYKTAVWGLILGLVYICAWLYRAGMSYKVLLLFLPAVFVVFVGLSRVVSEGGLMKCRAPLIPAIFTTYTFGSSNISIPSITALAFSYAWVADLDANFMTAIFQCSKLGNTIKIKMKAIFGAIVIATIVSFVVFVGYTLYLGYRHGAFNLGGWIYSAGQLLPFDSAVDKIRNPFGPDMGRLSFLGIGGIVGAVLIYMRHRFLWWPLSPLGFAVASVLPVRGAAFSIFLAWTIKLLIRKFGGPTVYRRVQPLFIGLVIGVATGVGVSFLVDMIWFPGQGHGIAGM